MRESPLGERNPAGLPKGAFGFLIVLIIVALSGCLRTVNGPEESLQQGLAASADATTTPDEVAKGAGEVPTPAITLQVNHAEQGPRVMLDAEVVGDRVVVRVVLAGFKNVVGLASHMRYDPTGLRLAKVQEHQVLRSPGFSSRNLVRESPSGRVIMGAARFREKTRPWDPPEGTAVGQQLWATLHFEVLAAGSHLIAFDPLHTLVKDVAYNDVPAAWGELTVTRVGEVK